MGLIITPQADITAYFESDALSQSTLKGLLKGFDGHMAEQSKEAPATDPEHFIIGSAVDCILTGEHGEFNKQYYTSTLEKKPSEAEVAIIQQVFDELDANDVTVDLPLEGYLEMLVVAIQDQGWYNGKPGDKRINNLIDKGSPYFEDLKNGQGKQIISGEQANKIDTIVNSLKTNRRTKRFFDRKGQSQFPSTHEFYYQLPIYFKYKGHDCKALLDLVVVIRDEEGNIQKIHPYDLKTMHGNNKYFLSSLKQRRYDIQAVWYTNALEVYFDVSRELIMPFTFIVESTSFVGRPLIFELTPDLLKIGQEGRPAVSIIDTNLYDGSKDVTQVQLIKPIQGIDQLMEDYEYYVEDGWREDKDVQEVDGYFKLDWEGFSS